MKHLKSRGSRMAQLIDRLAVALRLRKPAKRRPGKLTLYEIMRHG